MELDQILRRESKAANSSHPIYKGLFAQDASSLTDEVEVVIPAFSRRFRHGPCRFPNCNNGALPVREDECLVVFDEEGDPWVVVWYK